MAGGKILLIDDDLGIRGFLQDYFEDREYNVETASDGLEGLEKFQKSGPFEIIVCDMLMPRMIGLEFLKQVKKLKPDQRVIMMTGVKEASMVEKAKALGCHLYLNKPVSLADIEARVAECFRQ